MNFNDNAVPEIRIAPGHKPINFDKYGKKQTEKAPDYNNMSEEDLAVELMALLDSYNKPPQSVILSPVASREKEIKRQQAVINRLALILAFKAIEEFKEKRR